METVTVKNVERSAKPNREIILRDFIRLAWKATRGLTAAAESETREMIARLVDSGRVTDEQGAALLKTLSTRIRESGQTFEARVDQSIQKAASKLEVIAKREVERLKLEVSQLELRLEEIRKKKSK